MPLDDYCEKVAKAIKRDDIRGVYGETIDADFARALGGSVAEALRRNTAVPPVNVVVGHDMRLSGPVLAAALSEGLAQGGCRPIRMGLTGTELVGFLTAHYSDVIDGGVMVTASHNPPDHNGFKFYGRKGQPLPLASNFKPPLPDNEIKRLALAMKKSSIPQHLRWEEFAPDYVRTVIEKGALDFERAACGAKKPMLIAVEAGNGMGGMIMRELSVLTPQFEWVFSNEQPDGRFPKVLPNPLMADYQQMVAELVRESHSDIGVCFDGDADRVALTDENGDMISATLIATLIGRRLRQKLGPDAKIGFNLACSWAVADTLGDRTNVTGDGPCVVTPVGYGKIKAVMYRRPDIAFAAEHSGHYVFREFYTSDSGMLAGMFMLELAAELHVRGKTLSEELKELRARYNESGEINFQLPPERPADEIITQAADMFHDEAIRMYAVSEEGVRRIEEYPPPFEQPASDVRVEAEDWWFVMRKSGTEAQAGDICRLYVEAVGDRKLMEQKRDALVKLIGPEFRM